MPTTSLRSTRRPRRGFTLVELLVVMVMLGLVGSAITTVVVRQQRFYRGANEIIDTRAQIRQAVAILPTELRGLSSVGGDILAIAERQVDFRAPIGTSIVCQKISTNQFALPPDSLYSGQVLTSFLSVPVLGDTVFVYDDGTKVDGSDDVWVTAVVRLVSAPIAGTYCLPATGFTALQDASKMRRRYTLSRPDGTSLPTTIQVGAPIRFTRPVRYSLYRATDDKWYLGYSSYDVNAGGWSATQPVSGPYLAGDATAEGDRGLRFRLYNQAGTEVTNVAAAPTVTRVDIVVRGETRQPVQLSGTAPTRAFRDSLNLSVAIRNWR
jgi:prepilin-type N-terminal cleavage/methylation domain-containing protein